MSSAMVSQIMSEFRSGFVCVVGRPNAGKSTLLNALVGEKVAITSSKPQTTRHTVRGIINREDAQLVIIDTPGVSRPRKLLQERLNSLVYDTWNEVDILAVAFPANQKIGPGDEFIVSEIAALKRRPKLVALATKSDLAKPERMIEHLAMIHGLEEKFEITWEHIVPCSSLKGSQLDDVADVLVSLLPSGPRWYPEGEATDESQEKFIAELIREAALEDVRDELPHSVAVSIDEMGFREGRPEGRPLLDIFASLYVERDSQKPILIGKGGQQIKTIGTRARTQIKALLGTPVHLSLQVKVLKEWQQDPKLLNRLGF